MITQIERAIVARLTAGLGKMVRQVKSYGGELDDLAAQIPTLPAVWVTYGGSKIEAVSGGCRYQDTATFAVMCATRNLRHEAAGRQGGTDSREIGCNDLVWAVRRLLDAQRLGFDDSRGMVPRAVRSIVNQTSVQAMSLSVYAIEYAARFDSAVLENGRFPEPQADPQHPDHLFSRYQAALSAPYPALQGVDGKVYDPEQQAAVPVEIRL